MELKNKPQQYSDYEDEIDLVALAKTLWRGRNEVVKITLFFISFGLFIALTSPAEYTSNVVVKPVLSDSESKLGGNLGGLAAMAGIKLGEGSAATEVHPTLYPKILGSYSFQKELMESTIYVEGLEVSFEKYYTELHTLSVLELLKKYTLGLPRLILSSISRNKETLNSAENRFHTISETDKEMIKLLQEKIRVNVDEKQGFVNISATMPERLQAAQMVLSAQNILQKKVIDHKLKKAEENLRFIEERFNEKKKAFEQAQVNLAKHRDTNKNVNTAVALTEAERLESEFQLAFSVYLELAKQVETQKIQVKENTPVFMVLQEAVVPLDKSSTSKIVTLILWSVIGVFSGIGFIYVKVFVANIKKKWNE